MTDYKKFNINYNVKVRLTPYGHKMLHDDYMAFVKSIATSPDYLRRNPYVPPFEDSEGWSKWQMWSLMQELGKYLSPGFEQPFEMEILIEMD